MVSSQTRDQTRSPALQGGFLSTEPPEKPTFKKIFIGVLIYSIVLVSTVQQSDSVIHVHIPTLFYIFFSHIDHDRVLSRYPCFIQQVLVSYLFLYILVWSIATVTNYHQFSCLSEHIFVIL